MATILIIGSNSFVGNNFVRLSKFRDIEQISLFEKKPEEIDFSFIDVVIHLAAIVHQSKSIPENEYFNVNRNLCLEVATCAKSAGVVQFIFLSTVKVYGETISGLEPINEDTPCDPGDFYGKSKLEAEIGLRRLEDKKFTVSIIRTPLVYGDGVKANMLNIIKLIDKFPILPFGNIENKRSMTFVGNLVGFIDCIIERKASGLFIAMDTESLSTTELVTLISKYLGKRIILITLPNVILKIFKIFMPRITDRLYNSFEVNNSMTLEMLKFKTPYTSEEGIAEMVISYKNAKVKKSVIEK